MVKIYSCTSVSPLPRSVASSLSCGNPPSVDNSNAWVATDSSGAPVVVYSCSNVYSGFIRLICQNGSWYGQPPVCNCEYLAKL